MPPDPSKRKGPALFAPDLPNTATGHGERVAHTVVATSAASCPIACSPASCLGCPDRGVAA